METATNLRRRRVLDALLDRHPHDDPGSLPTSFARYAVLSQHENAFDDGAGFWYEFGDEPSEAFGDDVDEHGYVPFLVVDLDTGLSYSVKTTYALGPLRDDARYDFTALAVLDLPVDRSPRERAGALAEG